MKNKINRFYSDNFNEKKLNLVIPKNRIFFRVSFGGKYTGNFVIKSKDSRRIRGMIYTSSFRMQCRESGFDDNQIKVQYTFDAAGIPAGDVFHGKFDIISEAGEYEVPFTASVEIPYVETSVEKITNLEEFTKLAAYNYREAGALFESIRFREVLEREDASVSNLYEGLRKQNFNDLTMEEFLVSTHHKDRIKLALPQKSREYDVLERSQSDILEIGKNTWGYMPINIELDGDFIHIDYNRITSLDFSGNHYELQYSLRREKLHEGINTGKIRLVTPYETYEFTIIVNHVKINDRLVQKRRKRQLDDLHILQQFIHYKAGELGTAEWAASTRELLHGIQVNDETQPEYLFIRAFTYLEEGREDEAASILERLSKKRWSKAKEAGAWSVYAYLTARLNKDLSYSMKIAEEVHRLYEKNDNNWVLLWVLLQMEEYLIQNTERRLQVLEELWNTKHFHSVLYLEAFLTMCEQPGLIDLNSEFVIRTLLFAKRRDILNKEIAASVAMTVSRYRDFNPKLFEILEGCYEVRPTRDTLSAICRYLITNHCSDQKYFYWYELGVREELHIARLYEFFMYSINEDSSEKLPQAIYLYFSHQNELNTSKKAFMYANLIRYIESYPEIYENIKGQMEHFARTQLRAGKITANLRTLYRYYLPSWNLDEECKNALVDILYTYEVHVKNPHIRQVIVQHHNSIATDVANVVNGRAQVRVVSSKDHLIFKDDAGNLYVKTLPYDIIRMFPEDRYLDNLKQEYYLHPALVLDVCTSDKITDNTVNYYEQFVKMEGTRERARKETRRKLLFYFQDHGEKTKVNQYLQVLDDTNLSGKSRSRLLAIYLEQNQLKKAFELVRHYGFKNIDDECLMECCSRNIREDFYRENPVLLDACFRCFCRDRYDETILTYLIDCYCGRTADMKRLWDVAEKTGHNTHNLEERILIQMLFAEEVVGEEAIFYNYYIHGANEKVKRAYLSYRAYGYFVHNELVDDRFFEYIETEYAREEEVNMSCKLACLKYYAGKDIDDKLIRRMLEEFLGDALLSGYSFSYFQQYDDKLLRKYSLNNRIILQYCGDEHSKITIFYTIYKAGKKNSNYVEEIMPQVYHTIFLKEFLLFTGEVLDYYIVEENENTNKVVEVGRIKQEEEFAEFTGRFSAINKILNEQYPEALLEEYDRKNYLVTQLFRVL